MFELQFECLKLRFLKLYEGYFEYLNKGPGDQLTLEGTFWRTLFFWTCGGHFERIFFFFFEIFWVEFTAFLAFQKRTDIKWHVVKADQKVTKKSTFRNSNFSRS